MNDKKVIEYKLIELQTSAAFRNSSCFHLKEKYQPYGLPYIDKDIFRQVWVKYEENQQ